MVDEPRDMLCCARAAELLLYRFSDRDLAQARSARPDMRRQPLPPGVFCLVKFGLRLPSGAGTLPGTDAGNGGLFKSKSPIVLLDQPPQFAGKARNQQHHEVNSF